jgi:rhamnopyranosyl-N-acetylglucosaminyl-diphospho-decaprenol beta-1,3/1,4-galactofuranosyltransferase
MKKTVCAVIVTYNRLDILKKSLMGMVEQTYQPAAVIAVNNNSSDGTKEYLEGFADHPIVKVLHVNNNIGYPGGIELGMKYARKFGDFDYYLIMDDDTLHKNDTLEKLVTNIEDSGFGIMGLNGMNIKLGTKRALVTSEPVTECDYVLIDGALVTKEVVEAVGMPNEKLFLMAEDWEYCLRIRKHGYKVGSLNNIAVDRLYLGGQGGGYSRSTLWRGYYQSRNHFLIMHQYFSFSHLYGHIMRQLKFMFAALLYAPDRFKRIQFRLMGMWHGVINKGGKTLDPDTLKFIKH